MQNLRVVLGAGYPQTRSLNIGDPIVFTVYHELVQVNVLPAHCDLDYGMELGDVGITAHKETPPD
jgi:hypothetical protein